MHAAYSCTYAYVLTMYYVESLKRKQTTVILHTHLALLALCPDVAASRELPAPQEMVLSTTFTLLSRCEVSSGILKLRGSELRINYSLFPFFRYIRVSRESSIYNVLQHVAK